MSLPCAIAALRHACCARDSGDDTLAQPDIKRIRTERIARDTQITGNRSATIAQMHRKHVTSTAITSVGYDARRSILEIEFVSGNVYQYSNVPAHVHLELMASDSHGSYFDHHIRNAGYAYRLL